MVSDAIVCICVKLKSTFQAHTSVAEAVPSCIKNFFLDFSLLHNFMTEHGSNFQMQLLPLIKAHLKLLHDNFEKYFTAKQNATHDANSWIIHPFIYDSKYHYSRRFN